MKASKGSIGLKTLPYFPRTVRAIGAVFGIFGLAMIWTTPVIGLLFVFITTVIFTTYYGFEIELSPNSFREFVWVLGWKDGRRAPFKSIEFLFIQEGKFTFLTYSLREKTLPAHEGYIKFEGRNEVHFLTDTNKERLIERMMSIARYLGVDIRDYSDGKPIQVFSP